MPDVATTRGQPVYRPPASPIGDLISRHRELMREIYDMHRAACGAMTTWTQVNPLPRRKVAA